MFIVQNAIVRRAISTRADAGDLVTKCLIQKVWALSLMDLAVFKCKCRGSGFCKDVASPVSPLLTACIKRFS